MYSSTGTLYVCCAKTFPDTSKRIVGNRVTFEALTNSNISHWLTLYIALYHAKLVYGCMITAYLGSELCIHGRGNSTKIYLKVSFALKYLQPTGYKIWANELKKTTTLKCIHWIALTAIVTCTMVGHFVLKTFLTCDVKNLFLRHF